MLRAKGLETPTTSREPFGGRASGIGVGDRGSGVGHRGATGLEATISSRDHGSAASGLRSCLRVAKRRTVAAISVLLSLGGPRALDQSMGLLAPRENPGRPALCLRSPLALSGTVVTRRGPDPEWNGSVGRFDLPPRPRSTPTPPSSPGRVHFDFPANRMVIH